MDSLMRGERGATAQRLATHGALARFRASEGPSRVGGIFARIETVFTLGTLGRFLPRMDFLMSSEACQPPEALPTFGAFVHFISCMVFLMGRKVGVTFQDFSAFGMFIPPLSFAVFFLGWIFTEAARLGNYRPIPWLLCFVFFQPL